MYFILSSLCFVIYMYELLMNPCIAHTCIKQSYLKKIRKRIIFIINEKIAIDLVNLAY